MKKSNHQRLALWRYLIEGKQFFINPRFQTRFISSVLICVGFSLIIAYCSQYFFFHSFYQKGVELGLASDHVFFELLREQQLFMLQIYLISSAILAVVISLWALFYSHRIAGPLYRLNRYFNEASQNQKTPLAPLYFRKDDFFHELPESINRYHQTVSPKEN